MEDVLDEIAAGRRDRVNVLRGFYFGDDDVEGLKRLVTELGEIDAREMATFPVGDGIDLRVGRYGPYVETSDGTRANVPEDLPPDELTVEKAKELLANPAGMEHELGEDPDTGLTIVAKNGRFGPYVTEQLPEDAPKGRKPRTSSLFKSMTLETVTLADALRLLTLPRVVGTDPESGDEITAQNGRYGPYLRKGSDSRSIDSEDKLLTITLEEALAIYAQPKTRGRGAAASPGREIGDDPATGKKVTVKGGRFGPYVTDGEYNATLRQGDEESSISIERAAELLAERRAKGPAKKSAKKGGAKKTAKKSTAKKSATKSAAKKTASKKGTARKSS
ncbi:MAG: topoisomerase C-terminal repeat-containing protein, partial [Nocardioidaceae bacterium]